LQIFNEINQSKIVLPVIKTSLYDLSQKVKSNLKLKYDEVN